MQYTSILAEKNDFFWRGVGVDFMQYFGPNKITVLIVERELIVDGLFNKYHQIMYCAIFS